MVIDVVQLLKWIDCIEIGDIFLLLFFLQKDTKATRDEALIEPVIPELMGKITVHSKSLELLGCAFESFVNIR